MVVSIVLPAQPAKQALVSRLMEHVVFVVANALLENTLVIQ
jgi:hypothetical protein